MKDLAKSVVAICAIALVAVSALNHGMNSELTKVAILAMAGIALGADAVTTWLESRKQAQTT